MDIEEYIIKYDRNFSNFERLKRKFNATDFIPFVGAGSSKPLGADTWYDLFLKLKKRYKLRIGFKKNNGKIHYPLSFSKIYNQIDDKSKFFEEVFKGTEAKDTQLNEFYRSLVKTFYSFVTTNYDDPIELAIKRENESRVKNSDFKRHFFSCYQISNMKNSVVYLHGHNSIEFCIIKDEDYKYFYPTISKINGIPIIEKFLKDLYLNKSIIFIGFSFNDDYLRKYFEYLATLESKKEHYILMSKSSLDDLIYIDTDIIDKEFIDFDKYKLDEVFKFFERLNINPIIYSENTFIELFLESLNKRPKFINPHAEDDPSRV